MICACVLLLVCLSNRAQFVLVKSLFVLCNSTSLHNRDMMSDCSSDFNIAFPRTFSSILTFVKRQQEAWEIVKLEIRNNLMDETCPQAGSQTADTFCQELQDSVVCISSNLNALPPAVSAPAPAAADASEASGSAVSASAAPSPAVPSSA
jgi:hypothetical protein